MIIQCEQCGTNYRFDETLMDGDGAWVRCSRCQNVFFQANPEKGSSLNKINREDRSEKDISEGHNATQAEIEHDEPAVSEDMRTAKPYEAPKYFDDMEMEEEEEEDAYEVELYGGKDKRKIGVKIAKSVGYAFLSLIILIFLAALIFPQIGNKVFSLVSYTQQYIHNMTSRHDKPEQLNLSQVQIENVKQRQMKNLLVGNIRIIEGVVINKSKFHISNIKVKSELLNDKGLVTAQEESYCGNLLTDEELTIKTEDEMRKALSDPLGSDVPNERVAPGGQIPFMIIFTREPPDTAKTTVTITGAERLLP
ncbi:MAG: zinc-ribbon domain-containing protein [Deltaproteobacteria bacterium]|nr:zinc-ribbon domain-containing protein [Deltaproteobacteria bacterium]